MKTVMGAYIPLVHFSVPRYLYVRGHVSIKEALSAIAYYEGTSGEWYLYDTPEEAWARWSCEGTQDGEPRQVFVDYPQAGRGRFQVMRAKVEARHRDRHCWHNKRTGSWRNHKTLRMEPITREEDLCPCTHWRSRLCTCRGSCSCHWVRPATVEM